MKFIFLLSLLCTSFSSFSQTPGEDISLQLSATSQSGQITINWINDGTATGYDIYRRYNPMFVWGAAIANLSGTESSYIDNTTTDGIGHEYKIVKTGTTESYGYINASFEKTEIIGRGIIIVVVEDTYQGNPAFDNAVATTIEDIENDGWIVKRLNVNSADNVTSVKSSIVSLYNQAIGETEALYLIGHVPVPYSGLMNPDGHPDHYGAWPTDSYYADMFGVWTDATVNDNTSAAQARNHNVPGDGKFDQGINPAFLELQVGRVDFANMSSFADSEETLLIRYMNKAHMYKTKQFTAQERALIDDNFTGMAEGFSSSGYRNFSTMFTPANVDNTLDLRTATATDSYMWSYGCGAGSYTSCTGIGNTSDLAGDSLQTVFTMLFGSYFGDWDSDNNFLRAGIAQGQTLNSFWAGRPQWSVHHMSLGGNIGFSSSLTQNNLSSYFASTLNYFQRWIHISLMGDPTTRMHYLVPPTNLVVVNNNDIAELTWTASPDAVLGYNIYRLLPGSIMYEKLNATPVMVTNYNDNTIPSGGDITYIVKAVDLKTTASGSYINQSLGIRAITNFTVGMDDLALSDLKVYPNPVQNELFISGAKVDSYKLFTLSGQLVSSGTVSSNRIDFALIAKGAYYIELKRNNEMVSRHKLIRQ